MDLWALNCYHKVSAAPGRIQLQNSVVLLYSTDNQSNIGISTDTKVSVCFAIAINSKFDSFLSQ